MGVFHDVVGGSKDPNVLGPFFSPTKQHGQGKIQDFKMYLLLSKGGFSIAMFVFGGGGVVDNAEPALKQLLSKRSF